MSKTIQISDKVYAVIERYRTLTGLPRKRIAEESVALADRQWRRDGFKLTTRSKR
jgi:hypothetical protein